MSLPFFPQPGGGKAGDELQRMSLKLDSQQVDFWSECELSRSIDGYSTVSFMAPFEPDRKEFRKTFKPFSFKPTQLFIGSSKVFTGTLIDVDPDSDKDASSVKVSCYARPAVLHDCEPPDSAYPLEFNEMDIVQIASKICGSFGFSASVEQQSIVRDGSLIDLEFIKKAQRRGKRGGLIGGKGSKFARLALQPGDNPQEFLAGLAKQRGVVMTDDPDGNLLFRNSVSAGSPVMTIAAGAQPVVAVKAAFNPQDYFSEITAFTPSTRLRKGDKWTAKNPRLSGVIRPTSFKPDDTDKSEAQQAALAKLGRMFGNMVSWTLSLPTFLDPSGKLLEPNTTIRITAPNAMIYTETELLVRNVKMKQNANETSSELNLVLPGAFSGEIPDSFPWDEPAGSGIGGGALGTIQSLAKLVGL